MAAPGPLRHGLVRLNCENPRVSLLTRLGPEAFKYTAGFGGWNVVERPGQTGMTIWQGNEPLQMQLGLMMDRYEDDGAIAESFSKLMRMARGDADSPPGVITIDGLPTNLEWVIEEVDWGDPIRRSSDGWAVRQPVVLTLREYIPPEFANLRKRALAGALGKTRIIKAKRGDTPAKIAKRYKCKWTDLRTQRGYTMRKANESIKAGTPVRVPAARPPKKKKGARRAGQRRNSKDD